MVLPQIRAIRHLLPALAMALLAACSVKEATPDRHTDALPAIFPDYTGVTVPPNLVAPRFWVADSIAPGEVQAVFTAADVKVVKDGDGRCLSLTDDEWSSLKAASDSVQVTVLAKVDGEWCAYTPFTITVAAEEIDPYLAYRLIEPGYESWNEMGIYQRCLENYDETPIITNAQTDHGCMNCHSFCDKDPSRMMLHLRADYAGTYFLRDGKVVKIDPKAQGMPQFVYPSWHPSGEMVAYSTNTTKQLFHTTCPNRIEVFDFASDVFVYDVEKNALITSPLLQSDSVLETFPSFSPDGRRLYYCAAPLRPLPEQYDSLRYSICVIDFDPVAKRFGDKVDTVYNAATGGKSASFPRVSPDGRRLLFTLADYGTFSIWHRDADLYMTDLQTGETAPVDILNSGETESYHTWSKNGRWVVYSSRRLDGLYTRPYIAYVDADGVARKPLLLPPPTEDYYDLLMKSYNVPEFVAGKVSFPFSKD